MGAVRRRPSGGPAVTARLRIAVYALAKNEAANVARWAASCTDADVRVVTDTGSTDGTPERLMESGVDVRHGAVVPWRWDDAHTLSLNHVPANVDVCVRLDLDEVLVPGWREAIESHWKNGVSALHHGYEWEPGVVMSQERVHARAGYHWRQATHEGLVRWDGQPDTRGGIVGKDGRPLVLIRQHRQERKPHSTDLDLCQRAVDEAPHDARARWYLAREHLIRNDPARAREEFRRYLDTPGGSSHERANAMRRMAALDEPMAALGWLLRAAAEAPHEPEPWVDLAHTALVRHRPQEALAFARRAAACDPTRQNHASDERAYGPLPHQIAAEAAVLCGLWPEAVQHARRALELAPGHAGMATLIVMADGCDAPGPKG
ncbi:MAG: hypothetical protein EBR86_16875 [Planctomycetia bacterium]|nr:hypothetical protein [Planctomycetia bacterium]